ncbi:MAG: adenylosuccinate lyase [Pseudomonadota bacterium]
MTIKTLLAAAVLVAAPTLSMAMGCNYGSHSTTTTAQISCAEGAVYDETTGTCVPVASS